MTVRKLLAGIVAGVTLAGVVAATPALANNARPQFSNVNLPSYASTSLPMSFTVTDTHSTISSVSVAVNGSTVETLQPSDMSPHADGSGYDASTSIPTGTYADGQTLTVTLTANDQDDNTTSLNENVVVDHTKPAVAFTGDLAYQANPTAVIAFTATDTHLLSVSCQLDQLAVAPCSGSVTYTGLTPGLHTVRVTAVDQAGNTTTVPFAITDSAPRITSIAGMFTATLVPDSTGQLIATIAGDAIPTVTPTGTVTVSSAGRVLGTAPLAASATPDVATATLPVTTRAATNTTMTMSYSGDSFYPATSGLGSYVVHPFGTMSLIGAVRHDKKLTVGISCPRTATICAGTAVLGGKSLAVAPAPGKFTRLTFALPRSALAALLAKGRAVVRLDLRSGTTVRHLSITLRAKPQRKVT